MEELTHHKAENHRENHSGQGADLAQIGDTHGHGGHTENQIQVSLQLFRQAIAEEAAQQSAQKDGTHIDQYTDGHLTSSS